MSLHCRNDQYPSQKHCQADHPPTHRQTTEICPLPLHTHVTPPQKGLVPEPEALSGWPSTHPLSDHRDLPSPTPHAGHSTAERTSTRARSAVRLTIHPPTVRPQRSALSHSTRRSLHCRNDQYPSKKRCQADHPPTHCQTTEICPLPLHTQVTPLQKWPVPEQEALSGWPSTHPLSDHRDLPSPTSHACHSTAEMNVATWVYLSRKLNLFRFMASWLSSWSHRHCSLHQGGHGEKLKPERCCHVWWPQNDTLSCLSWDCKSNEENWPFIS